MNKLFIYRMICGESRYIWQAYDWPRWRYDLAALVEPMASLSRAQGVLLGRMSDVGLALQDSTKVDVLTEEAVRTSEIEGEILNIESVRSSVARRLGVNVGAVASVDRDAEGVVEMVLDATSRCFEELSAERLWGWHAALFPTGYAGIGRIRVGGWRDDSAGPMQVISGPVGRRKVHFEAPPARLLPSEMARFLDWANGETGEPKVIKAALAHLWFVTLHPFDDGNGRIARAIGDLFLARADGNTQRFYSLSAQIQRERRGYYEVLERTQKGTLDVTEWLQWFLGVLLRAVESAELTVNVVVWKARFWQRFSGVAFNDRQLKMLNRLLDGFTGKLTTAKWAAITKCSTDTALRDITYLLDAGVLKKSPAGGRSTSYELVSSLP